MQAKLHRWAAADPGRRFDDLFNLVYDPATLLSGVRPGRGQPGCEHAGRGRLDRRRGGGALGVPGFLDDLRTQLKDGDVPAVAGA